MNQSQCEQLRSTAVNRRHAGDFAQDNPEWEVQTHTAIVGRPALKVNSVFLPVGCRRFSGTLSCSPINSGRAEPKSPGHLVLPPFAFLEACFASDFNSQTPPTLDRRVPRPRIDNVNQFLVLATTTSSTFHLPSFPFIKTDARLSLEKLSSRQFAAKNALKSYKLNAFARYSSKRARNLDTTS